MAFDARTIRAYIADIRNGELKRANKAAAWVPAVLLSTQKSLGI